MTLINIIDKLLSFFINCLFVLAIIVLIVFIILPIFNINNYEILSGSMEPTIKTHSLVITNNNIDTNDLKENDLVLFKAKDDYVVHRAVKIDTIQKQITTKGDANKDVDYDKLLFDNVLGKVIFKSYILGIITIYASRKEVKICFLIIVVILFILKALIHYLSNNKKKKELQSS